MPIHTVFRSRPYQRSLQFPSAHLYWGQIIKHTKSSSIGFGRNDPRTLSPKFVDDLKSDKISNNAPVCECKRLPYEPHMSMAHRQREDNSSSPSPRFRSPVRTASPVAREDSTD